MVKQTRKRADNDTLEKLLTAAGDLMIERRSTEISLSDISAKSGVNSALVGYYFGNKSGLFMALLRKTLGPGMEQIKHLREAQLPPTDKLRIHISGVVNSYFRFPFVNHLMHRMLSEDPVVNGPLIAEEFSKPLADFQKATLEEGLKAGIFLPVDPIPFYFHVIGACDHLFYGSYQLEHVFGVKEIDLQLKQQYVNHLCQIILKGIMVDPVD